MIIRFGNQWAKLSRYEGCNLYD